MPTDPLSEIVNGGSNDALLEHYSLKNGVDPDLARRLMSQESRGRSRAVSPKGAQGLMQLMPGTARQLGVTDPFDVHQNLDAGTKYLRQQLDEFGDPHLALAAYNAGPGAVKKFGNKIPPYRETQNYVKKIGAGYSGTGYAEDPLTAITKSAPDPTPEQIKAAEDDVVAKSEAMNQAQGAYRAAQDPLTAVTRQTPTRSYDTKLSPIEEQQFQEWKQQYAPNDSGGDYDLRGAFKAGLRPDPKTGHWPDTFKKPNHPTFSNESQYARGEDAINAGRWEGGKFIAPSGTDPLTEITSAQPAQPQDLGTGRGAAMARVSQAPPPRSLRGTRVRPMVAKPLAGVTAGVGGGQALAVQPSLARSLIAGPQLSVNPTVAHQAQQPTTASRIRANTVDTGVQAAQTSGALKSIARMTGVPTDLLPEDAQNWINSALGEGSAGLMNFGAGMIRHGVPALEVAKMLGAPDLVQKPIADALTKGASEWSAGTQAMDRQANRGRVSSIAHDIVAGGIASSPGMALAALGVPPAIAFGLDSNLKAQGRDAELSDIIKETASGAATGALFELPVPAKAALLGKIAERATKAGIVGAGSFGLGKLEGQTNEQAATGAAINAAFAGSGAPEREGLQRGGNEAQAETQPNVTAQPEGAQPALQRRATMAGRDKESVQSELETRPVQPTSTAEPGAAASESVPIESDKIATRHVDLQPRRVRGEGKGQFKTETTAQAEERRAKVEQAETTTLYRGGDPADQPSTEGASWFTADKAKAEKYAAASGGTVRSVDVPNGELNRYRDSTVRPNDYLIPTEVEQASQPTEAAPPASPIKVTKIGFQTGPEERGFQVSFVRRQFDTRAEAETEARRLQSNPTADEARAMSEGRFVDDATSQVASPLVSEGARQPEIVKPWEMTRDQIEEEYQRKKAEDDNLEASILGPELAKRYAQLQRSANSSYDFEKANRASDGIQKIEASLSERDRNRLYGIGEEGPQVDELKDYRYSLGGLDESSPQTLAESLKWAIIKVGNETDPSKMNHEQQVAYGTLREAARLAHEKGWDTQAISREAVKAAAGRFSDPEDAAFMLDRFIKKEPKSTTPERKQIAASVPLSPTQGEAKIEPKGEPNAKLQPVSQEGLSLSANAKEATNVGASDTQSAEALRAADFPASSRVAKSAEPQIVQPETRRNLQAGGVDVDLLTLGVRPFAKDVATKGREVAAGTREISNGIKSLLAPPSRSEQALQTSRIVRANASEMARAHDIADRSLEGARRFFSKQQPQSNYDFIDKMERGQPQADPKTQKFADTFRQMLDERRDQIRALGTGKLDQFIEDYFPHIWKDPKKASDAFASAVSKRPFEGSRAFLKKRTLPLTADGLALGLEPVSNNPVDLATRKLREMDKYLMAHKVMSEMKDQENLKFFKVSEKLPQGWAQIDDRVATVFSRGEKGELILRGRYASPESAAKIINNYLSPGLDATAFRVPFRAWRASSNLLNQFQLGISAFHAGFTTVDAMVSRAAVGIEDIARGRIVRGVRTLASTPISPITNLIQGSRMLKEWYRPGTQGTEIGRLVQSMQEGGGRARMDQFYTNGTAQKFMDTLRQGNIIGAAFRAPGAIIETLSKPVMEQLVPRQKMGIFADMAKRELERLGPDASETQRRHAMAKAWDSVDNRMGQLVYDNLFWNKTLKDLSMASVRSVGWNIGTLREVGGGLVDYAGLPKRAVQRVRGTSSSDPLFTHRMAYVAALPLVVGAMGAMTQYLLTGKGPQELKDYFFPKTGALDENGNPERISFPSYMKDVFHAKEEPGKVVTNKLHPLAGLISEMLRNEDYYGTKIRNEDDPIIQQLKDAAKHVGESALPFSIRGYQKETERDGSLMKRALPFIGITPAPSYINKSPAEKLMGEKTEATLPRGARTREQADISQLRSQLRAKARNGQDIKSEVDVAIKQGKLKPDDAHDILRDAKQSPLQLRYKHLPLQDALEVWDVMTPDERSDVKETLADKASSVDDLPETEQTAVKQKLEAIGLKEGIRPRKPREPEQPRKPRKPQGSGYVFQ